MSNTAAHPDFLKRKVEKALLKNPPKKTRYARGMTSRAANMVFNKSKRKLVLWGMNLKPGDSFNSFDGLNHVVKSVKVEWGRFCRFKSGKHVVNVYIISTDGWEHHLDEWWCIVPSYTIEEIEYFHTKRFSDKLIELGIMDNKGFRLRNSTKEEQKMFDDMAGYWCGIN